MENQKPGAQGASAGPRGVPGKRRRGHRGGKRHQGGPAVPGAPVPAAAQRPPQPQAVPRDAAAAAPVPAEAPAAPRKSRNFRAATGAVPPPTGPGLGAYAFLDAQNISVSASRQRWKIDWYLVRKWLSDAYDARRAIMFLGYMEEQEPMYEYFNECGYDIVFKPVRVLSNGETKGNVDAEIVLHAMAAYPHYDRAVLISGDGDFSCLVAYLRERGKLGAVVAPNAKGASGFLEEAAGGKLDDMTAHRSVMTYVPGRPGPKPAASASGAPKPVRAKRDARGKSVKAPAQPKPAPAAKAPAPAKVPQAAQGPAPRQHPQQQRPHHGAQQKPQQPQRPPVPAQQPRPQQPKPQQGQRPQQGGQPRPQQPQKPKPHFPPRGNQPKPQQHQQQQRPQQPPRPPKGRPGDDVDYSDFASLNSF